MEPINFAEWKHAKQEAGKLPIELSDGSTVTIPAWQLWPEKLFEDLPETDPDTGNPKRRYFTNEECGAAILGQEDWDRFVADGGDWTILNEIVKEAKGLDAGK